MVSFFVSTELIRGSYLRFKFVPEALASSGSKHVLISRSVDEVPVSLENRFIVLRYGLKVSNTGITPES